MDVLKIVRTDCHKGHEGLKNEFMLMQNFQYTKTYFDKFWFIGALSQTLRICITSQYTIQLHVTFFLWDRFAMQFEYGRFIQIQLLDFPSIQQCSSRMTLEELAYIKAYITVFNLFRYISAIFSGNHNEIMQKLIYFDLVEIDEINFSHK